MELNATPALNPMSLKAKAPDIDLKKIEETAQDFEAMFYTEMMKPMFEGLKTDGMFGGGKTEEVFRGFLLDEYGKQVAATGMLGIADLVKEQLIEMQSKASQPAQPAPVAQNLHGITGRVRGENSDA